MDITLPIRRKKGAQSKRQMELYVDSLRAFADDMKRVQAENNFRMGARDWCYYLEPMGLSKSDFDWAQNQIQEARKMGFLKPGFILEEDGHMVEERHEYPTSPEEFHEDQYQQWQEAEEYYRQSYRLYNDNEVSFWEGQQYYLQIVVEKAALKSLFRPICEKYKIPIANMRGWGSMEQKAVMAHKFQQMERQGLRPVLLACGDFDPPGISISSVLHGQFEEYQYFTGWDPENLIVDRIGLTYNYIQENELVWIEGLSTGSGKDLADPNHKFYKRNTYGIQEYIQQYGARKVEANAVVKNPEHGRQMLRDAIDKWLGADAYEIYEQRIREGREEVRELIALQSE